MEQNKKRKLIFSFLFAVILLIGAALCVKGLYGHWEDSKVDTDTLFYDALADADNWQSYRYTLQADLTLNNYKTATTSLSGEVDSDGNLHVLGKIMDTEMEAYQFGDQHYRFRSAAKEWTILENSPLTENGVLLMMIEPALNFAFTDTISVSCQGKSKENGEKRWLFNVVPREGFHVADSYYTDFKYKVYVDAANKRLTDAVIYAISRTKSENRLKLAVHFYDINTKFTLQPPID